MVFEKLRERGFDLLYLSHASAILSVDFPEAGGELEDALLAASIPIEEIVAGGGGEAKGTQRLRRSLAERGWRKTKFEVEKHVNGVKLQSQSHEVDHVRIFESGTIALEIEWNNKDPFYDRDLENYKRLHADGAISVGVIVTRGRSLQDGMRGVVRRFLEERGIDAIEEMKDWGYRPTMRQQAAVANRVEKRGMSFRDAFVDLFVADKFGEATTHWRKLEERVRRGVGNPCPLVLIGLPDNIVSFGGGQEILSEVAVLQQAQSEMTDGLNG